MLLISIICLYFSGVNAISIYDLITIPFDVITIPQGNITGVVDRHGNYRRFLGIPYALVPDRFQAPSDPPKWDNVLYANIDSEPCPQYLKLRPSSPVIGNEQCLGLNVFTPLTTQVQPHPVMVFIFGGGWYWGSNNHHLYDPKYLVQRNVIVVTINYRCGAFGFLCLGNKGAPGNVGLKDQVAALKWVKNNINYFGGDPKSITLFGEDAGGASISALIASPSTEGLFHRVIMQSGTMLVPLAFDNDPVKTASSVAADLGLDSTDPDELLEFFKQVSVDDLVKASYKNSTNNPTAPYVFRPCAEAAGEGALITTNSIDLVKSAKPKNLKVIIGYNDKEGIIFASEYNSTGYRNLRKDISAIIPENMNFKTEDDKKIFIEKVKTMYFSDDRRIENALIDYFTDTVLAYPSIAVAESLLEGGASVYNYYFKYDSVRNLAKLADGMASVPGAGHGDELYYLFDPTLFRLWKPLQDDVEMIYKMTTMWASFARTGDPSIPAGLPFTTEWKESTLDKLNFLEIDKDLKMIPMPNKERIEFWKNAYNKYGFKY